MSGLALIHLLATPGELEEIPYQGWLFIGLVVALLASAAVLVGTSDDRVWPAAGGLAALVMFGYVLSRTIGLPQAEEDVGHWTKPLGLASLFVEGCLVVLSAGVLLIRKRERSVVAQASDGTGPGSRWWMWCSAPRTRGSGDGDFG
ncbi:MAG: hypothetical protein ACRDZ3_03760 [Acidimicrobiia bacterium]